MLRKLFGLFLLFSFGVSSYTHAQKYQLLRGKKLQKVKFELINNLIVIPVEVNGTALSFVLDSGVGTPILFNLADQDSVQLNNVSEITINGLGEGDPINALSSKGNLVTLKGLVNPAQKIYVVMDAGINFSPSLGVPIHGIIGYDLFKDLIVDINYSKKVITFSNPGLYRYKEPKNARWLPMDIIAKKAYVNASVRIQDSTEIPVNMLVDTGSSDAVWLFEDENIVLPKQYYNEFLGKGLSGNIYGKRTKINRLKIADFVLTHPKAAFPDMELFKVITNLKTRNGSLGGAVLKRFNLVFDYPGQRIMLRKNANFKKSFLYNLSGIDLQHAGVRYVSEQFSEQKLGSETRGKAYGNVQIMLQSATRLSLVPEILVSGIRQDSPAYAAGLKEGDVLLAVNGKQIYRYKLQEILHMLNAKKEKKVKVLVQRSQNNLLFSFDLKPLFKK